MGLKERVREFAWFDSRFKPATEYEKRIAELKEECVMRRDSAVTADKTHQELHLRIVELQNTIESMKLQHFHDKEDLDLSRSCSRLLENLQQKLRIAACVSTNPELETFVVRSKQQIAELERSNDCSLEAMRNAQAACQDEAAEKQQLQAEVERLKPNAKLGQFLLDSINAIGDAGLEDGWPRDEQIDAFINTWRRQKDEIERLKQQQLPPNKCIANKLSREQIEHIARQHVPCVSESINAIYAAIYGEQTAEAKEPTPREIIDSVKPFYFYPGKPVENIDDKIEALVNLAERLLAEKREVK